MLQVLSIHNHIHVQNCKIAVHITKQGCDNLHIKWNIFALIKHRRQREESEERMDEGFFTEPAKVIERKEKNCSQNSWALNWLLLFLPQISQYDPLDTYLNPRTIQLTGTEKQ